MVTMTQLSPRNSGRKSVLSQTKAITGLLWFGMISATVYLLNVPAPGIRSLTAPTPQDYGRSLGSQKSSFRSVTVSSGRDTINKQQPNAKTNGAFDWKDLQLSQNSKGRCGADKCFWLSNSDPESVGYLVASAGYHYKRMKKAYKFAVDVLEGHCNAKHLFLDAPEKIRVTPNFVRNLNSLKHNDQYEFADKMDPQKNGKKPRSSRKVFDEDDHYVVVQKVRVAPNPNLMFGFMAKKWEMLVEKDIPRFRSELQSNGISLRQIEEKLESERKGIECAMEYSDTYWYDLQGLIDLEGNYFHIDIDSQFWAEIGDPDNTSSDLLVVTIAMAYRRRQNLIGKFNDMIQRLVDPPPEGVGELAPWVKEKTDASRGKQRASSNSDRGDDYYYDNK